MRLARGLERRLENLVDGVSASVFRGRMHPVTIAARLVRQLDFLAEDTPVGPQIPNDLSVVLNPADLDPNIELAALDEELAAVVLEAANDAGWRLVGPVDVHVAVSTTVPRGILEVAGSVVGGPLPAWGQLVSADGGAVVPLTMNRILIGRALDCDIRFSNAVVSRHHAAIARTGGDSSIQDLGSSNGTRINGDLIAKPVPLVPGCLVAFGDLAFTYRLVA